jgi:hypothetical protein
MEEVSRPRSWLGRAISNANWQLTLVAALVALWLVYSMVFSSQVGHSTTMKVARHNNLPCCALQSLCCALVVCRRFVMTGFFAECRPPLWCPLL